jgi:hypothetical protein
MVCGVALPPTRGGLRTRRSILFRYTLLLSRGQVAVFALVLFVAALPLASGFALGSVRIVSGCGIGGAAAHPDPQPELAAESEHDQFRVLRPVPTPFVRAFPVSRASLQNPAFMGPPRIRSYNCNLRQETTAIIAGSSGRFRRKPLRNPTDPAITEKKRAVPAPPGRVSLRFRAVCGVGGQPVRAQRGAKPAHGTPKPANGPSTTRPNPSPHSNLARACCQCSRPLR